MKKWLLRIVAGVFVLYLGAAFFLLPYLVRTKVPALVHEKTGGSLQIDAVFFNPLILSLEIRGVHFMTPQGTPLFSLRRFDVNVDIIHLLAGRISIEHVGLYGPKVTVEQREDGTFNFDWLLAALAAQENNATATPQADAAAPLPRLILETLKLEDGSVDFTDTSRGQPLHLSIEPIGLTLKAIDTGRSDGNRIHFFAGTGSGGLLDIRSRVTSFEPFALDGHLRYDAGKLYLTYHFLQSISRLELADGRIHAAFDFHVDLGDLNATGIDDINVTLDRLRIASKEDHQDVLRVGRMAVVAGPILPLQQRATVEAVTLDRLYLAATRLADGTLDWQHFFPSSPEASASAPDDTPVSPKTEGPPWEARINTTALRNLQVQFVDRTLPGPARLTVDDFNLTLSTLSTDLSRPVQFENRFALNRSGTVEFNGTVTPQPLTVRADLAVDGLQLPPFNPYVETPSYASLDRGAVALSSRITYIPSASEPDLRAEGRFGLHDLLLTDTRDTMPLVSIAAFDVDAYLFEWAPNRLFVDTAVMDAFYANIMVDRNKTLNLATLMRPMPDAVQTASATPETASAARAEAFPVRVVNFVIQNGAVHFADASLPLPFDTQIHDVNGQVLGISSRADDTTYLQLEGEIDRYGTAKAEGSLNTGAPKRFTDIAVGFRNIELDTYSPYSGKFVGRAIDGGKLSVALRYRIDSGKMQGDNGLVINKIVLGQDIESNTSVSLPLDFAIALLEDRDGVIDIDMPVSGDVDNPEFKWGGVVWDAFVNLLTKAVTAPFELIGSMLGIEGDTLKSVPFEAGSSVIDAVARERLDLLSDALAKRPKLGITVQGTYDASVDKRALQEQALIAQVLGEQGKEGVSVQKAFAPGLLEPIYVGRLGEEALETLKSEIAKSDADEASKARRYLEQLVRTLVATQPLPSGALETLAQQRAAAIRTYMAVSHSIDGARMADRAPEKVEADNGVVASQIGLDAAQ